MGQLDGKVAVITGGASGIGERSARLFVEEGARVLIADMQDERGLEVARSLRGSALFQHADFVSSQPLQRAGVPENIASAALWLASDASAFVTGEAIVVDGGLMAGRRWSEQASFTRRYRPIRVYRPEGA